MHKYKYFFSKIKIFIYILYKKRGDFSPLPFFLNLHIIGLNYDPTICLYCCLYCCLYYYPYCISSHILRRTRELSYPEPQTHCH